MMVDDTPMEGAPTACPVALWDKLDIPRRPPPAALALPGAAASGPPSELFTARFHATLKDGGTSTTLFPAPPVDTATMHPVRLAEATVCDSLDDVLRDGYFLMGL